MVPYVKSIETHAHAFLPLNISAISSVIFCKHGILKRLFKKSYQIQEFVRILTLFLWLFSRKTTITLCVEEFAP